MTFSVLETKCLGEFSEFSSVEWRTDRTISGIANVENVLSSCGITVDADVERTSSTTGQREWSSVMTSRYSQEDNCLKSTLASLEGDAGNGDICNGSRVVLSVAIWHAPQDVVFFSTMLFMW